VQELGIELGYLNYQYSELGIELGYLNYQYSELGIELDPKMKATPHPLRGAQKVRLLVKEQTKQREELKLSTTAF